MFVIDVYIFKTCKFVSCLGAGVTMRDDSLHLDIDGYEFYIIMVFDIVYIILLYIQSLGLVIIDFKLIFNTKILGQFKNPGDFTGFTHVFNVIY